MVYWGGAGCGVSFLAPPIVRHLKDLSTSAKSHAAIMHFWDKSLMAEERTRIACLAFMETSVEESLDAHTCNIVEGSVISIMCDRFISKWPYDCFAARQHGLMVLAAYKCRI